MRKATFAIAALLFGATALRAQEQSIRPEFRPFAGAYLPIGAQRDAFNDAPMFGLQLGFELRPTFHLLGSFGWIPGQTRYRVSDNNVNVYAYDAGMEWSIVRPFEPEWTIRPFVGFGAGARTYSFKASELSTRTCASGYGALGTEFQLHRVAFRVEGRENVFCYRAPIAGEKSHTRTDAGLTFGLAYHFR